MTQALATLSQLASGDQLSKEEKLSLYKLASGLGMPSSIHSRVYDWWAEMDRDLFDSKLEPVLIHIGVTEYSGCLGTCALVEGQSRITLHKGIIEQGWRLKDGAVKPNDDEDDTARWGSYGPCLGEAFLKDVLLHEMIHSAQALHFTGRNADWRGDAHHCGSWSSMCNDLAGRLGLDAWFPVYKRGKTSGKDGAKRQNVWKISNPDDQAKGKAVVGFDDVSSFPHKQRQPSYYNPDLEGYSWHDLKTIWQKHANRFKRGS